MTFECNCCGRFPLASLIQGAYSAEEILSEFHIPTGDEDVPVTQTTSSAQHYFSNGPIIPMTGEFDTAECLLTCDDHIVFVGRLADCPPLDRDVVKHDLAGRCLIPGMIDPHVHVIGGALNRIFLDLSPEALAPNGGYSIATVLSALQHAVDTIHPAFRWVLASGFDPSQMDDWVNLDVDQFATLRNAKGIGILVQSGSGHISHVNQTVLDWAGLTAEVKDPPGGHIGRMSDNRLSGIFVELGAQSLLKTTFTAHPAPLARIAGQLLPGIHHQFETALKNGITTLNDAGLGISLGYLVEYTLLDLLSRAPSAPRIASAIFYDGTDLKTSTTRVAAAIRTGPKVQNNKFRQQAVKLLADGSNQGVTGFQSVAYTPWALQKTANYTREFPLGVSTTEIDRLVPVLKDVIAYGWQIMVHANGKQAVTNVISSFDQAADAQSADLRHRIEHCSLASDEDLKTMSRLGLSPSFLIAHATKWGDALNAILGKEQASLLDRCSSALAQGLAISLHSDHPVTPLGTLRMVQDAVVRKTKSGRIHTPAECISPYQALHAVTAGAAWQCHMDGLVGTLEPGKLADLVILDKSPLTEDHEAIAQIGVHEVYLGGRKVDLSR